MAVIMLRLDKYLADMGVGTRQEVKQKIRKGMVTVDDAIVKSPELKVDPDKQEVRVNGQQISYVTYEYYMLNKPAGVVSATEDKKEKTVIDCIESKKRKDNAYETHHRYPFTGRRAAARRLPSAHNRYAASGRMGGFAPSG